ncbi:MAG: response regulator [bacterium]
MRILVVDDSRAVQSFHRFALGMFKQLTLDVAGDGLEALKMLSAERYDVVLLDINMPLMDGLKVLSSLRRKDGPASRTPVIMITSEGDTDTARRATELGAFKVLTKPVAAHAVRDAVTEAMNLKPQDPPDVAEKRQEPRLRIEVAAILSGAPVRSLPTWDISPFGAFLVDDDPLPVGTETRLVIKLPHLDDPIEVNSLVVHTRAEPAGGMPAGFGVSFEHDSPELSERLVKAFLLPDGE